MFFYRLLSLVLMAGWFSVAFGFSENVDQAEARLLESAQNEWKKIPLFAVTHAALAQEADDAKWVARGIPLAVVKAARVLEKGGRTDVRYNQSLVTLVSDGEVIALEVNVTVTWECGTPEQRKSCARTTPDPAAAQAASLVEMWHHGYLFRVDSEGTTTRVKVAPFTVGCRSEFTAQCEQLHLSEYWSNVAKGTTPLWTIIKQTGDNGVLTRLKLMQLYEKEQQEFLEIVRQAVSTIGIGYGYIEKIDNRFMVHIHGRPPIMPPRPSEPSK